MKSDVTKGLEVAEHSLYSGVLGLPPLPLMQQENLMLHCIYVCFLVIWQMLEAIIIHWCRSGSQD